MKSLSFMILIECTLSMAKIRLKFKLKQSSIFKFKQNKILTIDYAQCVIHYLYDQTLLVASKADFAA